MAKADGTIDSASNNIPLIQASELAQYGFCRRAWWLGIVKNIPANYQPGLERGHRAHARHRGEVKAAVRWRQMGYVLLAAGGFFLLIAALGLWVSG